MLSCFPLLSSPPLPQSSSLLLVHRFPSTTLPFPSIIPSYSSPSCTTPKSSVPLSKPSSGNITSAFRMRGPLCCLLVAVVVVVVAVVVEARLTPSPKVPRASTTASHQRFLSLFSVVQFKNLACTGEGGDVGVCYTAQACVARGGRAAGECADGFGVCCVTKLSCGASTSNNCTTLQSPGYPATFNSATSCTYTITFSSDVCQVRLDVDTVDLAPPTTRGTCEDDFLTFSQDNKWERVCGTTIDSHFYLDVDPSVSTSLTLTFTTSQSEYERRWLVKASLITCDQLSMAPSGCGQYFTSPSGVIKGWNHDGIYLSGQNYAICVRKEVDMCSTTYMDSREVLFRPVCGDTLEWPFPVIGSPTTTVSCVTTAAFITSTPLTVPLLGPNYLYLVTTTDTTNDHSDATNVFYTYTQNPC